MISGTLARLQDPADDILESATAKGDLPALEVVDSQETFDGQIVQWGKAADRILEPREDVFVTERDGRVSITSEREKARIEVSTDWIAEVSGSGLLVAESTQGDDDFAFPFGLFGAQTNQKPERLNVDIDACRSEWEDKDALHDVTMAGDGDPDSTSLNYGAAAGKDSPTTIGIGFEAAWNGDIVSGVVWESGYVRTDLELAERFVQFVIEELWPHCYVPEDDEELVEQATLEESAEDDSRDDPDACLNCGLDAETTTLETRDGMALCVADADAYDRGMLTEAEIRGDRDGE